MQLQLSRTQQQLSQSWLQLSPDCIVFIYQGFKGVMLNVLQGFPPRRAIQNADVRNTANTEAYIANTDAY